MWRLNLMKVSEITEIWGISKVKLQEYQKKYKWWMFSLYAIDIFVMCVLVIILYNSGADAQFYMYTLVIVCVVMSVAMGYRINSDTGIAFQFYRKNSRKEYALEYYNLNKEVLYNILYCIGYRRLKSNKSMEIYMEMLLSACCENAKCAYTIMKFMNRYKSENNEGVPIYVLQGKKKAFLGFKSNTDDTTISTESVNKDTNTENDVNKVEETQ